MNGCASVLDSIAKGTSRSHDLLIKYFMHPYIPIFASFEMQLVHTSSLP